MKSKIFKTFVCIIGMIGMLMLQGCEKELESMLEYGAGGSATVKQVDVTVIIPIHPSSLKFFDYCIFYSDNKGENIRDTIREGSFDNYFLRLDMRYYKLPVICRCEVELIPKISSDTVVSFSYITPKPRFSYHIIFESSSISDMNETPDTEGFEIQKFDSISIGSFLSTYGSSFYSTYHIKDEYDGITCTSY